MFFFTYYSILVFLKSYYSFFLTYYSVFSYLLFQLFWNKIIMHLVMPWFHHCRFTSLEPTRPMPTSSNLHIYGDVTLDRYCVSAHNKLENFLSFSVSKATVIDYSHAKIQSKIPSIVGFPPMCAIHQNAGAAPQTLKYGYITEHIQIAVYVVRINENDPLYKQTEVSKRSEQIPGVRLPLVTMVKFKIPVAYA